MTISETLRSLNKRPLQLLALFILLQLFITLFTDGFALSFDEAMWHYIGRNWFRNGLVPYNGGIDNKSPLIFAVFGLSDRLFGVNYWFPRVLGTIFESAGIYYVYKIARYISGERAGLLATSIYGLSLLWHATGGKYVSYTETYEVMFTILAVYRYISARTRGDMLLSGLLAGFALGFRFTGIFGIIAIFLSCARKNVQFSLTFCAGVMFGIIILTLLGHFMGISFDSMYTYALADNFGPGSVTSHTLLWKWQNFSDKLILSGMVLFYPLVAGYIYIKRKLDLFLLWFILALAGICVIGIFDNVHLKELLPSLSLMGAFCLNYFTDKYHWRLGYVLLAILILFLPRFSETLCNIMKTVSAKSAQVDQLCAAPFTIPDEGSRKALGRWVRDNTNLKDKVYVAGYGAQVQAYTERLSPTVYFNVTQTVVAKARFFEEMNANHPEVILVPMFLQYKQLVDQDMRQFVDTLVAKHYQSQGCMYNYNIYHLRK
ncbi:MAG: ArnT family glycosyltransferase [Mucilaginibacter sp.]